MLPSATRTNATEYSVEPGLPIGIHPVQACRAISEPFKQLSCTFARSANCIAFCVEQHTCNLRLHFLCRQFRVLWKESKSCIPRNNHTARPTPHTSPNLPKHILWHLKLHTHGLSKSPAVTQNCAAVQDFSVSRLTYLVVVTAVVCFRHCTTLSARIPCEKPSRWRHILKLLHPFQVLE